MGTFRDSSERVKAPKVPRLLLLRSKGTQLPLFARLSTFTMGSLHGSNNSQFAAVRLLLSWIHFVQKQCNKKVMTVQSCSMRSSIGLLEGKCITWN